MHLDVQAPTHGVVEKSINDPGRCDRYAGMEWRAALAGGFPKPGRPFIVDLDGG